MRFDLPIVLLLTVICGSIVAKKRAPRPASSNLPLSEQKYDGVTQEKKDKYQKFLKRSKIKRANNSMGKPQSSSRMQRYEVAMAKKKSMVYEQRQTRIRKAQEDFNSRVQIDSPAWVEKYPLSVFCKNFTDIPNKEYFKSRTLNDEAKTVVHFPCIPAMILPVALDPHGFAARLFASVDHCISNMYIYKSHEVNITESLESLDRRLVRNIIVRSHPFPIRLTQGWNSVR